MLFDPRADLEIPVGIEELRGHGDQLRDLAVVVLELEDLRVALEIVEVVNRAQREIALQVSAHDRDLRLVQRWVVEELPPLGRELAVVRKGQPLEDVPLLLRQLPHRVAGIGEDLVRSDLVRGDLEVRRERLDRGRRRCRGWGARPWPLQLRGRPGVERARQLVEELPPGRREVALRAWLAPRPAVLGGDAPALIALRL